MIHTKVRVGSTSTFPGNIAGTRLRNVPHLPGKLKRILKTLLWLVPLLALVATAIHEVRTSAIQSWFFTSWARKLFYKVETGPSPSIVFPGGGPFDVRSGYTAIPNLPSASRAGGMRSSNRRVSRPTSNV